MPAGEMITDVQAKEIEASGLTRVGSPLSAHLRIADGYLRLVLRPRYGQRQAGGRGNGGWYIAAQSIGQPGTQLTMRTFHTGGVAGSST